MKKTLVTIILLSCNTSFSSTIPQVRDDEVYKQRTSTTQHCSDLLKNKKYDDLEKFLDKLDTDKTAVDLSGQELTSYCLKQNDTEGISNWIKSRPNSKYAKLSMYKESINQFFKLRGNDYIQKTDPGHIKRAQDFLDIRAELMESMKKLGTTRIWYQTRIPIAFYQSDKKIFFNLLDEAAKKYPDYFPIYTAASENMTPMWGWSYELMNNLALFAVKKSQDDTLYAQVYLSQINTTNFKEIIQAGYIDKQLFLNGINKIIEKYPSNYNYNYYAMAACKFREKDLTKDIINNKMKTFLIPEWIPSDLKECIDYIRN